MAARNEKGTVREVGRGVLSMRKRAASRVRGVGGRRGEGDDGDAADGAALAGTHRHARIHDDDEQARHCEHHVHPRPRQLIVVALHLGVVEAVVPEAAPHHPEVAHLPLLHA